MTSAIALRTQLHRYMQMLNVVDTDRGSNRRMFKYFYYVNKRIPSNVEINFFIYMRDKGESRGHSRPRQFIISYRTNKINSITPYLPRIRNNRLVWSYGCSFRNYKYAFSK